MRLICPNCDAQYEVPEDAIPEEGRDVQCSSCGHAWFQQAPHLIAAAEDEAALFDPPLPEPEPEEAPSPEEILADLPEPQPDAAPHVRTPRRAVDENLLAMLREEAERETQARAREEPRPLETQGELGLDMASPAVAVSPAARRLAALKGIEDEAAVAVAPPPKGRDLLPDIEEINSTLRPADRDNILLDHVSATEIEATRNAFRSGLALMVLLAVGLVAVYVLAPGLADRFPALAGPLDGYINVMDALRLGLDGVVRRALALVQG